MRPETAATPAVAAAAPPRTARPRVPGRLLGALRFATWWHHIVPPLLATVWAAVLLEGIALPGALRLLPWFLASVIGISGFGYFLNDVCDVDSDRRSGKSNAAAALAPGRRAAALSLLLALGLAPWLWLPSRPLALALLAVQVVLLVLYSAPPVRLKERGLAGVAADALYGHLLPVLITAATFFAASPPRAALALALAALWLAAKGARNILVHQLADRRGDRAGGLATVASARPVAALAAVNRVLLPLELAALAALLAAAAGLRPLLSVLAAFLAATAVEFSAWKFPHLPPRQLRFKFLYFMNDFYEEWMAPAALVLLALVEPLAWVLLPLQLALFPRTLTQLPRNSRVMARNLGELWSARRR